MTNYLGHGEVAFFGGRIPNFYLLRHMNKGAFRNNIFCFISL